MTTIATASRRVIRNVGELLRLTESATLRELEREASWWADPDGRVYGMFYTAGRPAAEWEDSADPDYKELLESGDIGLDNGWHQEWVDFPITVAQFWKFVVTCYVGLVRGADLDGLPDWLDDEAGDVTHELAGFFGVGTPALIGSIGGGWQPVEPTHLYEWFDDERIKRWYSSGNPRLVLLGLTAATAVVEVPHPQYPERALEQRNLWVDLSSRSTLRDLAKCIGVAVLVREAMLVRCPGCRQQLGPEQERVCERCRTAYLI